MCAPLKEEERLFTREFLKLYRTLPSLWQVSSKMYSDKDKKNESYKILVSKYREKYPSATRECVRKRINTLRTNYRKELKKTQKDSKYVSKLWYFNEIQFLNESMEPLNESSSSNYKIEICSTDGDYEEIVEPSPMEEVVQPSEVSGNSIRWKWTNSNESQQPEPIASRQEELGQLARIWANDLSKISPQQQMFAKKAIFDILFEAQMGTLHRNSVKINQ